MSDEVPRLYLVTPPINDAKLFKPLLSQALSGGDVASILIRFAGDDARQHEAMLRDLAPLAQEKGVAVLTDNAVAEALRIGADGAHIHGSYEEVATAVKKLAPRYIVGAGEVSTRDDAMEVGELGVDYVQFVSDHLTGLIERIAWWSELFTTPCVAKANSLLEIAPLVQAGVDFVMIENAVWTDPRQPGAAVSDALRLMQELKA